MIFRGIYPAQPTIVLGVLFFLRVLIPMSLELYAVSWNLDEVSDDFNDFSLSSSARKIRRLLPPIMEEEREQEGFNVGSSPIVEDGVLDMPSVAVAEAEADPVNEERAIVLYKPLFQSSPSVSVSLDSVDLVPGFKNQFLRASHSGQMKSMNDEEYLPNRDNATAERCLAVVPWVPSQFQLPSNAGMDALQTDAPELMEADDTDQAAMEIEDNNSSSTEQAPRYELGGMRDSEGLHQWQQQHCLIPPLPQSNSTAVTWFQ